MLRATVLTLALMLAPLAQAAEKFSASDVYYGKRITRDTCTQLEATNTAIWVDGDCIRYYSAGLKVDNNPIVLAYLTGDLINDSNTPGHVREYDHLSGPEDVLALAGRIFTKTGMPYIWLGRPGLYGSSGDHRRRRQERELLLVNGLMDALKAKYHIVSWSVSGQSGGGGLVGGLLIRRTDLKCAVSTSGNVSVKERARLTQRNGLDPTGLVPFDPIEHVSEIKADPQRRIYIIGDPRDSNVPFISQQHFFDQLIAHGVKATIYGLPHAQDAMHHGMAAEGYIAMVLCAEDAPEERIATSFRKIGENLKANSR